MTLTDKQGTTSALAESTLAGKAPKRDYAIRPICLVLGMPGDGAERSAVHSTISRTGLTPVHPEDIAGDSPSLRGMWTLVLKAPVLIIDCRTSQDRVWYLLGLAHAAGKPVVLLADQTKLSEEIRSLPLVVNPTGGDFQTRMAEAVRSAVHHPDRAIPPMFRSFHEDMMLIREWRKDMEGLERQIETLTTALSTMDQQQLDADVESEPARPQTIRILAAASPDSPIPSDYGFTDAQELSSVVRVGDLKSACTAVANESYDLILVDPELSPYNPNCTIRTLRAVAPQSRLVMLIRAEKADLVERLVRLGADDYVVANGPEFDVDVLDRLIASNIVRNEVEEDSEELVGATEHEQASDARAGTENRLLGIGRLAAGVAHEINTPMQYIGDNLTFLRDSLSELTPLLDALASVCEYRENGDLEPRHVESLLNLSGRIDLRYLVDEIPTALGDTALGADRVSTIVRALKEFSHPGGADKRLINLQKEISSTLTVCRNEWKYIAKVDVELEPELPPVSMIPGDLNQALLNLVMNAADAVREKLGPNPTEAGQITISARRADDSVSISVADSGPGIADEIRERILEPFFTTKDVGQGTGQGLALVHALIVEKHGGQLYFDSSPGEGATFTIQIPLAKPDSDN